MFVKPSELLIIYKLVNGKKGLGKQVFWNRMAVFHKFLVLYSSFDQNNNNNRIVNETPILFFALVFCGMSLCAYVYFAWIITYEWD